MDYFTADLHLGHANAIRFKNRPFSSIEEMNETLINNINEVVGVKDQLYILGDFSYRIKKDEVRRLRNKIACHRVHLIYGNHDSNYDNDRIFSTVQHYLEMKTDYGRFVLFHYPIVEWSAAHYGSVHLHGHIHSTGDYNTSNLQKLYADRFPEGHTPKREDLKLRIYDVGVDANDYRPISIERIAELMGLEKVR